MKILYVQDNSGEVERMNMSSIMHAEQIWSSGRPEGSDAEERQEIVVVRERQKSSSGQESPENLVEWTAKKSW